MYKVIYYNLGTPKNQVNIESKSSALCQYHLLKNRYKYCAVLYKGEIIIGKLLEDYNKTK